MVSAFSVSLSLRAKSSALRHAAPRVPIRMHHGGESAEARFQASGPSQVSGYQPAFTPTLSFEHASFPPQDGFSSSSSRLSSFCAWLLRNIPTRSPAWLCSPFSRSAATCLRLSAQRSDTKRQQRQQVQDRNAPLAAEVERHNKAYMRNVDDQRGTYGHHSPQSDINVSDLRLTASWPVPQTANRCRRSCPSPSTPSRLRRRQNDGDQKWIWHLLEDRRSEVPVGLRRQAEIPASMKWHEYSSTEVLL